MKFLIIFLIIFFPLLGKGQGVYKVTGPDLRPQIAQSTKTIDSLKNALIVSKSSNTDCLAKNTTLSNSVKTKSDSIILLKNALKIANDTIYALRNRLIAGYNQISKTRDSLNRMKTRIANLIVDSANLVRDNKQLRIDTSIYKTQAKVFKYMSDTLIIANNKLQIRLDYWEKTDQLDSLQLAYFKNLPMEYANSQYDVVTKKVVWTVKPWFKLQSIVRRKNTDGTMDEFIMTDLSK